jgi:predicted  nucleic acid-binding Zn-ribbon protein
VRGTVEPQKLIYGQALVSGPITFVAVAGTDNNDLYHQIALAGHECESITDIHFDNEVIPTSAINSGAAGGGAVTTGTFGPLNGTTICKINKHLGTSTQAADADLVATFTNYTSAHQGKGIANIVTKWTLTDESQEVWDKKKPSDIKALVKGKNDIYDPRLDTSAGANPSNSSYQGWSDNPALCIANYLTDTKFGLGVATSKIDWAAVVTAANACDVSVAIPTSTTEKRFTANGVLFGTDSHRNNIDKLLSAMNGDLIYTSGKYVIHAGVYAAPTESLDEDDLTGAIAVKTSVERSARFNKVTGTYISPSENHKTVEFPAVQLTAALNRDNGETLTKNVNLPFTNSSYMAQRLANKMVQLSDQQKVITFPANFRGLRVAVGDRVSVTVSELNYSAKVFRCVSWSFSDTADGGVNLTLVEDDSSSYADPTESAYSTVSASGVLTQGFPGVPDPQNLTATAGLKNIELNWSNPTQTSKFNEIAVYASPNSSWASKVEIGRVRGTQFIHDASNAADPISPGDTRYYWIRALAYGAGSGAGVESDRNPDNDTSNVSATCGRVNWSDVSGTTGAPADNATVGGTFGTDIKDGSGNVINFTEVENSVLAQQILEVEVESGDVLDLESGVDVAIENLSDVAIYVSDNSILLQNNIDTVSTSLSNLENTVADVTSGTSDVFVSTSAPVAGVGGVPDPIPTFSRWYDSDDNNHPYYWTGSAWVSLEDPRIASNSASITSLTGSLNTTNVNVTTAQTTADSKIVSLFQDDEPSTSGRTTGDLWFDTNDSNKAYRFNGAAWVSARDTGIQAAITNAAAAQSTADGKIDSFYQDDEPAANVSSTGDLWFDTNDGNKVYRYSGTDWEAAQDSQIATAISDAASAQSTADGKVTTFFGSSAPTAEGIGDLWFDTSDKNKLHRWSGSSWVESRDTDIPTAIANAATAQATADGKIFTFVQDDAPTATAVGDLWIDSNDNNKLYRWSGSAWVAVRDSGIQANANAINVLDTTVTNIDGTVTALSSSNTSLRSEFDSLVKIQNETADTLTTESNDDLETETLDTITSALTTADQDLNTLIIANEDAIKIQSTDITTLRSDLTTTNGAVDVNSTAIGGLATRITEAEDSITSIASDITTLETSLTNANTNVTANASAIGGLAVRVTSNEDSITSQSSDITSLQSSLTDAESDITANATAVGGLSTRVTATENSITSQSSDITTLQSDLADTDSNVAASATAIGGLSTRVTAAENSITSLSSDITSLESSLTTAQGDITANATAVGGLSTRVTAAEASITSQSSDITTLQSNLTTANTNITANATAVGGLSTRVTDAEGDITSISSDVSTLSTTVGGNTASISTQATSINGLEAQYTVKIDNNGRVAGFGLASTGNTSTPTSEFAVVADQFSIVNPSSTSDNPIIPFQVSNNKILMTSDVEINGNLMVGTISANRLDISGTYLSVVNGQLTVTGAPGSTTGRSFSTDSTSGGFGTTSLALGIASSSTLKFTYEIQATGMTSFGQSTAFPATLEIHKSTNGGSTYSVVKSIKFNPTAANNVDVVAGWFQAATSMAEPGIMSLTTTGTGLLSAPSSGTETAIFKCRLVFSNQTGVSSVDVQVLLEVF